MITSPDPAATDEMSEYARDGAARARDPSGPVAVVGLGASAGGVAVLQQFFEEMAPESGLAFVVVMHLAPDFESNLANIIQQKTSMPVLQVFEAAKLERNHIYVIPPNKQLVIEDCALQLTAPQQAQGRRVTIDLFFRTLAQSYGQRAVGVILSGSDSDGVIGLKHIRAHGGVTIVQNPEEAEHDSMPLTAISTGMVDWVLPVAQMPGKLLELVENENRMQLPPEIPQATERDVKVPDAPGGETISQETRDPAHELALEEVLGHLRAQTGHDFTHYKRATILRRIARRLQVNSLEGIPQYLDFLRTHPAEARALLQDLLIGVTHFFRDQEAFAALEANVPQLFGGKKSDGQVRVWVAGCATGEEAYSIAMLLSEYAERLPSPPSIQIFASDIDEQAIHDARDGLYLSTIEADVSQERLRHFFSNDRGRYRVKKDLRERVLFASHNLLKDAPFSRLDLISCRNLLIYLNAQAQAQVFDICHFALRPGGLLFIGGAETADPGHALFTPIDAKQRVFVRKSVPRPSWKLPLVPVLAPSRATGSRIVPRTRSLPPLPQPRMDGEATEASLSGQERRSMLFGELHLKLLEQYGPPSVVVNEAYDIVHLSEHAGRYLHFAAGEPSANLPGLVQPSLRMELRTALFRAAQTNESVTVPDQKVELDGSTEVIDLHVRPLDRSKEGGGFFLVLFEARKDAVASPPADSRHEAINRDLDDEVQFLKEQLNATIEQYEASNEELKASNEELQAMNEEMRSAAEELETSKEELQSVNEELTTVNNQLKTSIEDLSRTNTDLDNLMSSTDIGTIFLDRQLRVKRFTPSAQAVFNLLPADLGRPLSDITNRFFYPSLIPDAEKVLQELTTIEHEIRGEAGNWLLTRIAPYRTAEDRIAGVVATFIDISRRKHAEDELRDLSQELKNQLQKFNTVMQSVPDFIYHFDLEGRFTYVNQALLDLWGKTYEEAVGKNFHELDYPPDLATKLQRQIQEVIETRRPLKDETPYTSAIGLREYEYIFFPLLKDDGSVESVGGVTRDITDRRQAERALRESEARFRAMYEQATVGIVEISGDHYLRVNPGFCQIVGYSEDELKRIGIRDLTHPEDYPREKELTRQLTAGEISEYTMEKRYLHKDGSAVWATKTVTLVRGPAGEAPYILAIVAAIGDRKRAEEQLRVSEERFRQFAENSADVFWILDARTRQIEYVNPVYEKMWGESREALGRDPDNWLALVHPDDRAEASTIMPRVLAGEIATVQYRIVRQSDGETRWIRDTGFPIRNEIGEVYRVAGVAQDITEDKARVEALRRSEEHFRLLVEGARDYAMFLLDPESIITFWSKGAERVFGWSQDEAIGQSGEIIFTPEDRANGAVEKEMNIARSEGRAADRRFHLRKDGSRFWADGVLMRLDDEWGALGGFAKVARDASDQRAIEDALRQARDQMEQRVIERTQDLTATNKELERTMEQRQVLEKELLEISEREKRRIGEDLHDMVCQELTATALFLRSSATKLASESPAAAETLEESAQIVNRNVGLTRDLARGLQPAELKGTGLKQALRLLAEQACESADIKCHFKVARGTRVTDDTVALHIYRVAQEAVNNAIKHSGASNILITLDHSPDHICVSVEDDGKGFSPRRRSKGLGLHIMRYRANALGGELKIEKRPHGGMDITCKIPQKK